MRSKMGFIIKNAKVDYTEEQQGAHEGAEADASAHDATEHRMPGGGGPSPGPHDGGGPDIF